jgi:hypothetical protein
MRKAENLGHVKKKLHVRRGHQETVERSVIGLLHLPPCKLPTSPRRKFPRIDLRCMHKVLRLFLDPARLLGRAGWGGLHNCYVLAGGSFFWVSGLDGFERSFVKYSVQGLSIKHKAKAFFTHSISHSFDLLTKKL